MCGCGRNANTDLVQRSHSKEVSTILDKWIKDNLGRKLLVKEPIYDVANDIVGYITESESGNTIRIFRKNVIQVLE